MLSSSSGCFLARCLAHNGSIETLELRGNQLGPRTLSELAASLDPHECHHARATNPLRATGQRTMTEEDWLDVDLHDKPENHTPTMSRLRCLNLDANPLTGAGDNLSGIEEFASMLAFNSTLKSVSFFRCDLGERGCHMLVIGVRAGTSMGNAHLHSLDISYNGHDVKPDTVALLTDSLQMNRRKLAELKGAEVVRQGKRNVEAAKEQAVADREAKRVAYLQWMEDEKAARVAKRLAATEAERAKREEEERKAAEEAARAAEARKAAEAGAKKGKKGKKGKKKK